MSFIYSPRRLSSAMARNPRRPPSGPRVHIEMGGNIAGGRLEGS